MGPVGKVHRRWLPHAVPALLAAFILAIALFHGLRATHDINWHPGSDAYRDIALAQIILDGNYPADYQYLGEWLWYNPLTGALVAALSWSTGLAPPQADVRMAPYINLAVPLAFFVLAWRLFGGGAALLALTAFLFVLPQERPGFVSASYAPWLLAPHLTQAFFYSTVILWLSYLQRGGWLRALLAGVLLGVTFLGHTVPAVLLGGMMVVTSLVAPEHSRQRCIRDALLKLAAALGIAFIVSLPFTISILFRYHLHVIDPEKTQWVWEGVALENLPGQLKKLANWRSVAVAAGVFVFALGKHPRPIKLAVLTWPALAAAFLALDYAAQWGTKHGVSVFHFAPGYHFVIYLIASGHLFFALGLTATLERATMLVSQHAPAATRLLTGEKRRRVYVGTVAALILLVATYRDFRVWHGFTRDRTVAHRRVAQTDQFAPYYWIVRHAPNNAVFLCDDFPGIYCVAPAGARVVAGERLFGHIYVPIQPRHEARRRLWEALQNDDAATFAAIGATYHLTHVLAQGEQRTWARRSSIPGLQEEFASEQFVIFSWTPGDDKETAGGDTATPTVNSGR